MSLRYLVFLCFLIQLSCAAEVAVDGQSSKMVHGLDETEASRRLVSSTLYAALSLALAYGVASYDVKTGKFHVEEQLGKEDALSLTSAYKKQRQELWLPHAQTIVQAANRLNSSLEAEADFVEQAVSRTPAWESYVFFNYAMNRRGWLPSYSTFMSSPPPVSAASKHPGISEWEVRHSLAAEVVHGPDCEMYSLKANLSLADPGWWRNPPKGQAPACSSTAEGTLLYVADVRPSYLDDEDMETLLRKVCNKDRQELLRTLPRASATTPLAGTKEHYILADDACEKAEFGTWGPRNAEWLCGTSAIVRRRGYLQRWFDDATTEAPDKRVMEIVGMRSDQNGVVELVYIGSGEGL